MRLLVLMCIFVLGGCSQVHVPVLPGPADVVDCHLHRENSLTGTYECTVKGQYQLKELGEGGGPGL